MLYSDLGPTPNIGKTIQHLQGLGQVFVLTNNSYLNPTLISSLLDKYQIRIPAENILSSGHGLQYDPEINPLIRNRSVYVFGTNNSYSYVTKAGGTITESIADCDTVALCASLRDKTEGEYQKVFTALKTRPNIPIVCCNPDRYIRGKNGHLPVIGWWAEKLQSELNRPIHWIGKPYPNYSALVKTFLNAKLHRWPDPGKIWFFDDNPENIKSIVQDLKIHGCWVYETGLQSDFIRAEQLLSDLSPPVAMVPSLIY